MKDETISAMSGGPADNVFIPPSVRVRIYTRAHRGYSGPWHKVKRLK